VPQDKILIIAPAWVGDMVMAQSLFILLRSQGSTIDVLAPRATKPLLERMPEIHETIEMPLGHGELNLRLRYRLAKQLRSSRYTQAIVLTNSLKSALVPWFAKIRRRTSWTGESRYFLINDMRTLNKTQYPLMIERFLMLGIKPNEALPSPLPHPHLHVTEAQRTIALNVFSLDKNKPIVVLCPGAEFGPAKRWPAKHFAEVAEKMMAQGSQVWLFGGPKDQTVCDEINAIVGGACVNLAGKTNLLQAVDLLSCVDFVVTNDSGLMHVSAALDKPLVALYGSSAPSFTPPLSHDAKVLSLQLDCSPCFQRECPLGHLNCLNELKPEKVLQALSEFASCV
jgi:heptosyltransferase II